MAKQLIILLLGCLVSGTMYATRIDSLEAAILNSSGIKRCYLVADLYRTFSKLEDAGGLPIPESCIKYAPICMPLAAEAYDLLLLNRLRIAQSAIYLRAGQGLKVIELLNEVLVSQEPMSLHDSLDIYAYLYGAYSGLGLYKKAIEIDETKRQIAEKMNRIDVLNDYASLGTIYLNLRAFDAAALCYKKNIAIHKNLKKYRHVGGNYNNLGLTYEKWGKLDSALIFYKEAKFFIEKHFEQDDNENDKMFVLGLIDGNMAKIYLEKGAYQIAETLLNNDIAGSKRIKDFGNLMASQLLLARSHLLQKQPKRALAIVEEAEAMMLSKNIATFKKEIKLNQLKAEITYELKQYQESALFYKTVASLQDSLQKEADVKNKLLSNNIQQIFQQEKELMLEKNKLSETKIKLLEQARQKEILFLFAIALSILAIIGYFETRRNKRKNELLSHKNEEIERQKVLIAKNLKEKETLLREIQHRVKNNLQVISGMLQLQSSSLQNADMQRIMEQNQARIKAMAMVHQHLYQQEKNIGSVSFEAYLKNLVQQIKSTYYQVAQKIEVEINAADIKLDINMAIPLGIIVNELMSNAFKYAFEGREKGKIAITVIPKDKATYLLIFKDDGVGLVADFKIEEQQSLGMKLVKILSRQLKGSMEYSSDNGLEYRITFLR